MKHSIAVFFLIAAFNHVYGVGHDELAGKETMLNGLQTFNKQMEAIAQQETEILRFLRPLNHPPWHVPRNLSTIIKAIPGEFKNRLVPVISFLKEEHLRYNTCLASFDRIYEDYKCFLTENKKTGRKNLGKLDKIAEEWSILIQNAFPLIEEMIEMWAHPMKCLGNEELSDIPVISTCMWAWSFYNTDKYFDNLVTRAEETPRTFENQLSKLRQKLPEQIPDAPNANDFLVQLKKEFGPLKKMKK